MNYSRFPHPALRPFIKKLWVSAHAGLPSGYGREHVIPTGEMHLVFRLSATPLRIFNGAEDCQGKGYSSAVIGGPRVSFYCKDIGLSAYTVGAQLHAGVGEYLFGATAADLADRHTNLDDVWGFKAELAREALMAALDPEAQLRVLEALLRQRLPKASTLNPVVKWALAEFAMHSRVGEVVKQSGYSHRYLAALFQRATGLTPKVYCRVQRLQHALKLPVGISPAERALLAGYSDQAHFQREFRAFTGVTPAIWRAAAPEFPHHIQVNFIQDKSR
jgi:AraC-like DNA-binding protein